MSSEDSTLIIGHQQVLSFAIDRVNLSPDKITEYRGMISSIEDRLARTIATDRSYGLVQMMQTGSIIKGTALRTAHDFDLAIYLRPHKVATDEKYVTVWMVERLKEALPELTEYQFILQDHSVRMVLEDGKKVDIVPVLAANDDTSNGYLIRRPTGTRVLTNIPRHLEFTCIRKARAPQHFCQVVRLVKWWVRERKEADSKFRFKPFLSELLCARMLDAGVDMSNYPDALSAFFTYIVQSGLHETISFTDYYDSCALSESVQGAITVLDPVNPANNIVSEYTRADRLAIVSAAQTALDALDQARNVQHWDQAVDAWHYILGRGFEG